jgi:hypothetical protein
MAIIITTTITIIILRKTNEKASNYTRDRHLFEEPGKLEEVARVAAE